MSRSRGFAWKQICSFASACMPSCGCAAREVELGGDARLRGVGLVMEQALEDLERVVAPTELDELRGGRAELGRPRRRCP